MRKQPLRWWRQARISAGAFTVCLILMAVLSTGLDVLYFRVIAPPTTLPVLVTQSEVQSLRDELNTFRGEVNGTFSTTATAAIERDGRIDTARVDIRDLGARLKKIEARIEQLHPKR